MSSGSTRPKWPTPNASGAPQAHEPYRGVAAVRVVSANGFSPDAIADIKERSISYHVPWGDGRRTAVRVVAVPSGEYLRTDRDRTPSNNLTSLPNC
jgi:Protein of unknown function (DUF3892)